jgi:small subunit ribosomal protein S18
VHERKQCAGFCLAIYLLDFSQIGNKLNRCQTHSSTYSHRGFDMTYFRRRVSPIKPGEPIDYKDVDLLRKFVTERGKILPRRITGLTAKQQRDLTQAIKRARIIALLPFINREG